MDALPDVLQALQDRQVNSEIFFNFITSHHGLSSVHITHHSTLIHDDLLGSSTDLLTNRNLKRSFIGAHTCDLPSVHIHDIIYICLLRNRGVM